MTLPLNSRTETKRFLPSWEKRKEKNKGHSTKYSVQQAYMGTLKIQTTEKILQDNGETKNFNGTNSTFITSKVQRIFKCRNVFKPLSCTQLYAAK